MTQQEMEARIEEQLMDAYYELDKYRENIKPPHCTELTEYEKKLLKDINKIWAKLKRTKTDWSDYEAH